MNFRDIGIIIAKKSLQEKSSIISLLSHSHGLRSGVVNNYSRKSHTLHQVGNLVEFSWKARLEEHIGSFTCELIKSYSGCFINNKKKLYAFNSILSLISVVFLEREPHNKFYMDFIDYLNKLVIDFDFIEYIRLELELFNQAGYALQLDRCGVTAEFDDLAYVSPKSGKAISRIIGRDYSDKLLVLPNLLKATGTNSQLDILDISHALALTTYFFKRYFFYNKRQPLAREMLITLLTDLN